MPIAAPITGRGPCWCDSLDDLGCSQGWAPAQHVVKLNDRAAGTDGVVLGSGIPSAGRHLGAERRTGQCGGCRLAQRLCRVSEEGGSPRLHPPQTRGTVKFRRA